jgi:hypothetical protein
MVRSVLSVLAGIAVLTLASFAIEVALNPLLLHAFPEVLPGPEALASKPWVRALTLAYGLMCVATGGYIGARVAPRLPITHASVVGSSGKSHDYGNVVSGREPCITIAVDQNWQVLSIPAALVRGVVYKGHKPNDGLEKAPASA